MPGGQFDTVREAGGAAGPVESYPTLKPDHVRAALQYGAAVVAMGQSVYD